MAPKLTAVLTGPSLAANSDEAAAARAFRDYLDALAVAPSPQLAVVIAAYNEAENLPAVLAAMPDQVAGLSLATIVVDDGSSDATEQVARAGGALVARLPGNHGQGVALRLGYQLARELGVSYIATLDADGQYNPAELEKVVAPLVTGRADFVTGSRRLGRAESPTTVRRIGTRVFALLVSALVGHWVTDTSNGLRAMRSEVTARVRLEQPQYQASELLLGAFGAGYRVLEVPTVIHRRASGRSKKGSNLSYGARYTKVVFGTWWRELRRRDS